MEVTGPRGDKTRCTIMDTCPECALGSVDLIKNTFLKIATEAEGRVHITSIVVPCNSKTGVSDQPKFVAAKKVQPTSNVLAPPPVTKAQAIQSAKVQAVVQNPPLSTTTIQLPKPTQSSVPVINQDTSQISSQAPHKSSANDQASTNVQDGVGIYKAYSLTHPKIFQSSSASNLKFASSILIFLSSMVAIIV